MDLQTLLVHGYGEADPSYNAISLPIYLTTTYRQQKFGGHEKFAYSRGANPTRQYLESLIAQIEGGKFGFAFSSGMAASAAALAVLHTGDRVLIAKNIYGGTLGLLNNFYSDFGLSYGFADTGNLEKLEEAFDEKTKAVFIETPSNPLLDVTDIEAVSALAHRHGAITIVDNTFLSPYLQRPLELGADIVVESATKFLSGHSDVIAGVAAVNDEKLAGKVGSFQKLAGGIAQPFDSYLIVRGIKTLGVRIDRQTENAEKVAAFLSKEPAVQKLYYPGLKDHPGYAVNRKQSKSPGSMLSFDLAPGYDTAAFFDSLELLTVGASLGSVETLIQHPATGSHSNFTAAQRLEAGIGDKLIRISVGIENSGDIIEDLRQAFAQSKKG
jgi:cystathionine beta-lyase